MPKPDGIDSALAIERMIHDACELAVELGLANQTALESIAEALSRAYLRGVTDGGNVAMQAIDDVFSKSSRVTVN